MSSPSSLHRQAFFVLGTMGDDAVLAEILRQRGFAPPQGVATVSDLVSVIRANAPALVFLPVEEMNPAVQACLAELRRQPKTRVIAVAPRADAGILLAAMRAGLSEFLASPVAPLELNEAVARLFATRTDDDRVGQIFALYSAKGGVGTSTLAAALAFEISQLMAPRPVSLVDFNTAGAGLRVMLNLQPLYDLSQVASQGGQLDREFLRSLMIAHPEQLSILASSDDLDSLDSLSTDQSLALLQVLRQEYAFTVLDTDHHFNSQTMAALDAADKILLVTQLDVAALRSAQRSLSLFAKLGYPDQKIEVVANRCTNFDRITPEGAERVLNRPIISRLPNDYFACSGASTDGTFVQCFDPNSALTPAFGELAAALTGRPLLTRSPQPSKSVWQRMLGR